MALNNVYHGLMPIFNLYYLFGGLRRHQTYDKETKTYKSRMKFFSWSTMYTMVLSGLQAYMVFNLAVKCLRNFDDLEEGQKLNAMSFMFNMFMPMLTPIFSIIEHDRVSKVFEFWFQLQKKVEAVSISGVEFDVGIRKWCQNAMICTLILVISIAVVNPLFNGIYPDSMDFILALGVFYGSVLFSVYYASCKGTWRTSHRVLGEYKELLGMNMKGINTRKLDEVVVSFQPIWLDINNAIRIMGSSAYLSLATSIIIYFELVLYVGYMLFSGIGTIHWNVFIIMVLAISTCGFTIFAVCTASHQLSCKIKADLVEAIEVTKKLRASKPIIRAINKFLLHLIEISPPLNLDGYMTIDRSLLTTLLATFITTTVVLVQLKIGNDTFNSLDDLLEVRRILFK